MNRSSNGPPQGSPLRDRLISCFWWLVFMGGVAVGTATGVVLALWLLLPPFPGLLLIVACWVCGNVVGWRLAARLDTVTTRKDGEKARRIHAWRRSPAAQLCRLWVAVATCAVMLETATRLRLQARASRTYTMPG